MPRFIASTSRGLGPVLEQELRDLDLKVLDTSMLDVTFESSWSGCYKANLWLRSATRVMYSILDFPAYQNEELYQNIQKHDFTKYIDPSQTIAVEATVRDSSFKDQRFVALKVKDAIVDQFREKFDVRPDVDSRNPDLEIVVRVVKNQVSVSLNTSGKSLAFRSYRKVAGEAPLREHLAAGLVMMAGWDRKTPLVDPMCGSGTFLIEAALMAGNVAPGTLKSSFSFQKWKNFNKEAWDEELQAALDAERDEDEVIVEFFGSDKDKKVIAMAQANARRAGVDHMITFRGCDVRMLEPPFEEGMIVVNPPYGKRLQGGEKGDLQETMEDFAFTLKSKFRGWSMWLLSGDSIMTATLKMKATQKYQVYNGPIECRWMNYKINR